MKSITETKYHSFCSGPLTEGCVLCVKGRKLVLFITGLCAQRCFYCPISEEKFGKDVIYANEWKVLDPNNPLEMIEESRMIGALGAGITGGDPLVKIDRCVEYINLLKKEFGKEFHIHLYTPLKLVSVERLKKLAYAGLDEIRFHPDLDDETLWKRINLSLNYNWKIGVEIPCIPGYEQKTKKLIDFISDKVAFLNLNELELSDTAIPHYKLEGMIFKQKSGPHYGVAGSKELGLKLIKYAKGKGLPTHFCTAKLKDSVQVGERLKNRAKNAAFKFDNITDEGLFIRGVIYLRGLEPAEKYEERLRHANHEKTLVELRILGKKLQDLGLKMDDYHIDERHLRIVLNESELRRIVEDIKSVKVMPAIVEEYPTVDSFLIEVEFL